jgi:ribosomal RNA-processing protein 12
MVSAAVKGLARLAYEFSDLVSTACNLLPSTFLLLQRKNKEIIKVSPFSLNYLIRSLFSLSLSLSLSLS